MSGFTWHLMADEATKYGKGLVVPTPNEDGLHPRLKGDAK